MFLEAMTGTLAGPQWGCPETMPGLAMGSRLQLCHLGATQWFQPLGYSRAHCSSSTSRLHTCHLKIILSSFPRAYDFSVSGTFWIF